MIAKSICPHLSVVLFRAQRSRTLRTLCLVILLPSEPHLPELSSRYYPLVYPRPLLSTLWLPPVYVPPIHHHHILIVIPSISRRSFLAFLFPRLFAIVVTSWKSSFESWVNEFAITIFHVDFGILVPALSSLCMYDHILVLQRDAASWNFLRKFITKPDNAEHSNVNIRLTKDTLRCVNNDQLQVNQKILHVHFS